MMKLPRKHGVYITDDQNEQQDESPALENPVLEIEKDIPIPDRTGTLSIKWRMWPFERMEVGDSFLLRCSKDQVRTKRGVITSAILRYRRKEHPEQRFTCRTVQYGVRCWRVQ